MRVEPLCLWGHLGTKKPQKAGLVWPVQTKCSTQGFGAPAPGAGGQESVGAPAPGGRRAAVSGAPDTGASGVLRDLV